MIYLANSFSLNMLNIEDLYLIAIKKISLDFVKENLSKVDFYSCVGHKETAEFLTLLLDFEVKFNRENIKLEWGDKLIVFQLNERLPEGKILTKEELKNFNYNFYYIELVKVDK
jgi:hypothetical protein